MVLNTNSRASSSDKGSCESVAIRPFTFKVAGLPEVIKISEASCFTAAFNIVTISTLIS